MAETEAPFTIARRWNDFLECPQGTARSTALARAKSFNASPKKYRNKSNNARNIDRESVSIRKLLRWVLLASEHAPASPTCTASPLARTSPFTATLQNSRCRERITFPIRKFFRSDVESIESVGAVGAVFEEVFFRFGKFFAAFVFSEAVAAAAHTGCLNGED